MRAALGLQGGSPGDLDCSNYVRISGVTTGNVVSLYSEGCVGLWVDCLYSDEHGVRKGLRMPLRARAEPSDIALLTSLLHGIHARLNATGHLEYHEKGTVYVACHYLRSDGLLEWRYGHEVHAPPCDLPALPVQEV